MTRIFAACLGLGLMLATLSCGNAAPSSITVSPQTADAQDFPNGRVQFTASAHFHDPHQDLPMFTLTWCVGSADGRCNGNVASVASIDGDGVAQCQPGVVGTATILAGIGPMKPVGDGGQQLQLFGAARLTCP